MKKSSRKRVSSRIQPQNEMKKRVRTNSELSSSKNEVVGCDKENIHSILLRNRHKTGLKSVTWSPTVQSFATEELDDSDTNESESDTNDSESDFMDKAEFQANNLNFIPDDITTAEDDMELEYLERKLGLKGDEREKNMKRLLRQLHELDGFDTDIVTFAESCGKKPAEPKSQTTEINNGGMIKEYNIGCDDSESHLNDDDEMNSSKLKKRCITPKHPANETTPKYVPPGRRQQATKIQDTQSFDITPILKHAETQIIGLVNRISEGNLSPISEQISNEIFLHALGCLPKKGPQSASSSIELWDKLSKRFASQVISAAIENANSTTSLVSSQTAVLVGLTVKLSFKIGEQYLIGLVDAFEKHWHKTISFNTFTDNEQELTLFSLSRSFSRFAVIAYSLLYDFGLLDSSSIFSLVRRLFSEETKSASPLQHMETRIDLLLTCLRHVGGKLRSQAPTELRDILSFAFSTVAASGQDIGSRGMYLMKELEDIKNNKINLNSSERVNFVRQWVEVSVDTHLSNAKKRSCNTFPPELTFSIINWEEVAAKKEIPTCPASATGTNSNLTLHAVNASKEKPNLIRKAETLRLHTDLQKMTFVALVGAVDVPDAVQRVVQVANQAHQVAHAVAVVLHTSLQEKLFNPYYPQVLIDLACLPSSLGKRYKREAKQGIIAQLSVVHDFPLLSVLHFSKFIACICLSSACVIDLRILRFMNFSDSTAKSKVGIFLKQLCIELFERNIDDISHEAIFTNQFESLLDLEDIVESVLDIINCLVIPHLTQKAPRAIPRAQKAIKILSGQS